MSRDSIARELLDIKRADPTAALGYAPLLRVNANLFRSSFLKIVISLLFLHSSLILKIAYPEVPKAIIM